MKATLKTQEVRPNSGVRKQRQIIRANMVVGLVGLLESQLPRDDSPESRMTREEAQGVRKELVEKFLVGA